MTPAYAIFLPNFKNFHKYKNPCKSLYRQNRLFLGFWLANQSENLATHKWRHLTSSQIPTLSIRYHAYAFWSKNWISMPKADPIFRRLRKSKTKMVFCFSKYGSIARTPLSRIFEFQFESWDMAPRSRHVVDHHAKLKSSISRELVLGLADQSHHWIQ